MTPYFSPKCPRGALSKIFRSFDTISYLNVWTIGFFRLITIIDKDISLHTSLFIIFTVINLFKLRHLEINTGSYIDGQEHILVKERMIN